MASMNLKFHASDPLKGQAALSLSLIVGGASIIVGILLLSIILSLISSVAGFRAANQALAIALGGGEDAVRQLIRNNNFSSPSYQVPIDSYFATVSVSQASGVATITSRATILFSERRIRIIASVNPITGEVNVVSTEQIAI